MRLKFTFTFLYLCLSLTFLIAQNSDSIPISAQDSTLIQKYQGEYVVFNGDSLFLIERNLGPYRPLERAQAISDRLGHLAEEFTINVDSFHISDVNNYSIISYKDFPLMSISEADASSYGKQRHEVAEDYMGIIKNSLSEVIEQATLIYWVLRIVYTLLAIAGLWLIINVLNRLFKWLNKKLSTYEKGLKRKRKSVFKYLVPNHSNSIFLLISKVLKLGLIIFILFLYLPFMFSFLPWTQGLAEKFYGYIADPVQKLVNGFISFIPNLFAIFVIIIITRYFLRILTYVSGEIEDEKLKIKGFHRDWARPTFNLVKILIYAMALVFIFQYLPSSKAFQGVSIFVGVLFTLGSTSAISNMIAGIVITYMRPFVIGDRVKIGETVGDIVEKNLLVTRLKTIKNEDITIPNATIINTHLWNYSKNASSIGIILHTSVTIGYDIPSETVVELLLKAAHNTKNLTRELKPFVLQKGLNDFYVEYELNVYTKQPKKMAHFYSELHKNILDAFNEANIEILSPHYSAYRDGNETTIPQSKVDSPAPPENPVTEIVDKLTGKK